MADITISAHIFKATFTEDLSSKALTFTTSFGTDVNIVRVTFSFSVAVVQTVKITIISGSGSAFDNVVVEEKQPSATSYIFVPDNMELLLKADDNLKVEVTNVGQPVATANVEIVGVQE